MINRYLSKSKDLLGGEPVFKNTRVPVKILFDYIEGGDSIHDFIREYPTVSLKQVTDFLKSLEHTVLKAS